MDGPYSRRTDDAPWYSHLTVDLFWHVLKRSFFHWFVAWIIPLSMISVGRSVHHPIVILSCIYAALVDAVALFFFIDNRIAYGGSDPVKLSEEVVVVTGGANGLGLIVAQMFGLKGATVAVLDTEDPDETEVRGVTFFKCDVADSVQLFKAAKEIRKSLGTPTVLINNAGVVNSGPVFDMSEIEVENTYRVNVLSQFDTIRTFLPDMLSEAHGTIVTISSVLGYLGSANLGAYSSTKAALIALHASLRSDLRQLAVTKPAAARIKTVLVTPGQLNTRMFSSVQTPSRILAPVVEPIDLAKELVRYVEEGRCGEIATPLYTRYVGWMDILPAGMRELARRAAGLDRAMGEAIRREEREQRTSRAKK